MLLENGHAQGVKRKKRDRIGNSGQKMVQAFAHLVRGPAGKRNGQAVFGTDVVTPYEMGDTMGEGAGFPGARPGNNQQWAGYNLGGLALVAIESG